MIDADARDQTPSSVAKPRRLRFSLLSLLIFVGVAGAVLGNWFYYRPLTVTVDARFAVVDRVATNAIFAKHSAHQIDGSPFEWITLTDDELPELLTLDGQAINASEPSHPHTIPFWPQTAFTAIWNEPRLTRLAPSVPFTAYEFGSLNGFIGSRRAGIESQLRVQCDATCRHPDFEAISLKNPLAHTEVKGKLFYEGTTPAGHLVFIAPVDDNGSAVIIFDVK